MDPADVTLEAQLNPKKILPQTKGWSEEKGVLQALWSLFGGLSSRGRRQRRGGAAVPSCSVRRQGTFGRSNPSILGAEVRRPGSEGSVAAPARQVSC